MSPKDLKNSTDVNKFSPLLQALWHDAHGDWERAHDITQNIETPDGAWVHAYLHRKEGDQWNADYWYRRAGKVRPTGALEEEWKDIVQILLQKEKF